MVSYINLFYLLVNMNTNNLLLLTDRHSKHVNIQRTPLLISSNSWPWDSLPISEAVAKRRAIEERITAYEFRSYQDLKDCYGSLHPHMWKYLVDKYVQGTVLSILPREIELEQNWVFQFNASPPVSGHAFPLVQQAPPLPENRAPSDYLERLWYGLTTPEEDELAWERARQQRYDGSAQVNLPESSIVSKCEE